MGTQQGDNGGNLPPDGGGPGEAGGDRSPDDPAPTSPAPLTDLPPEWGEITIPDDPSELADEAEQVRRELAEPPVEATASHRRPSASAPTGRGAAPSIGVPLVIMSVAMLITLVSLFAMAWSGTGSTGGEQDDPVGTLPGLVLTDAAGQQVPVAGYAPAAFLLVEGCANCAELVTATVAAAPAGVTVVAVGHTAPDQPPGVPAGEPVPESLADPDETLRAELGFDPPVNAATVVLVDQDRRITRTVPEATSVGQFRADLTDLAPG